MDSQVEEQKFMEEEEEPEQDNTPHRQEVLKNAKFEYYLSMCLRLLSHIIANYSTIILNVIFPSIKNERNMNLNDEEAKFYLSIVSSAYFYGSVVGALLVKQVAHLNVKTLWRVVVTTSIFVNLMFQIENLAVMAICRFVLGCLSRLIAISNYW